MDEYGNKLCNFYFENNPTVNYYKQWQGYIRDTLVNNELREIHLDSNFNEIKTTKYYSARHLGNICNLPKSIYLYNVLYTPMNLQN